MRVFYCCVFAAVLSACQPVVSAGVKKPTAASEPAQVAPPEEAIGQIKGVHNSSQRLSLYKGSESSAFDSIEPAKLGFPLPYFVQSDNGRVLTKLEPWGWVWLDEDRFDLMPQVSGDLCTAVIAESGAMVIAGQRSANKGCKRQ